jgi:hypothetical protein
MPNRKGRRQKVKPSKEVTAMVKATKAKKAGNRKREDFSQAAARIVKEATEG